jgi:hypothetical protein
VGKFYSLNKYAPSTDGIPLTLLHIRPNPKKDSAESEYLKKRPNPPNTESGFGFGASVHKHLFFVAKSSCLVLLEGTKK